MTTTCLRAEQVAKAAEVAHEDVERVGQVDVLVCGLTTTTKSRLAVPIEGGALLRIAKHVVRFRDGLELFLGVLRSAVAVGVPLHCQSTVRLLDVVV